MNLFKPYCMETLKYIYCYTRFGIELKAAVVLRNSFLPYTTMFLFWGLRPRNKCTISVRYSFAICQTYLSVIYFYNKTILFPSFSVYMFSVFHKTKLSLRWKITVYFKSQNDVVSVYRLAPNKGHGARVCGYFRWA